jgi:chromosome segregation ATPase
MLKNYFIAVLLLLAAVPAAQAKDLSALQTAVEVSRDAMRSAQAEYNSDVQRVEASKKNLEDAKKRLAEAQAKADQSRKRYQEAKARYDKAQTTLDNAWKQ